MVLHLIAACIVASTPVSDGLVLTGYLPWAKVPTTDQVSFYVPAENKLAFKQIAAINPPTEQAPIIYHKAWNAGSAHPLSLLLDLDSDSLVQSSLKVTPTVSYIEGNNEPCSIVHKR